MLDIGGVKFFPVESVAAVFENKSRLDSATKIREAIANVMSVKALN